MAVDPATVQTYDQSGRVDDWRYIIYQISPEETPLISAIGRDGTDSKEPKWQKDNLRKGNAQNKVVEGDVATNARQSLPVELKNYCQLMDGKVSASSEARAINTAGRSDELEYQVLQEGKAIRIDMEARACGNYASSAGTASTPREAAGYEAWMETNVSMGATGSNGGFQTGTGLVSARTDGTKRDLSEDHLKAVLRSAVKEGGRPTLILANAGLKQLMSTTFTGIATQRRDNPSQSPAAIIAAADTYVSDFGMQTMQVNVQMQETDATDGTERGSILVVDPRYWAIRELVPFGDEPLAKVGHSDERMISVSWTLESRNEASGGLIADLNVPA